MAPHIANTTPVWLNGEYIKGVEQLAKEAPLQASTPLTSTIDNFYMTDAISRASRTMAKCVQARQAA
ncbi:hypothetical protein TSOC_008357 [Tetrabaena socialis]|uniref:NADH-ubiquinone oxidoreductase 75 kDa subunit mitochondrial-like domain-containing protein n=1 Tax=Tetrabaena socialis TaxID=47790 RepID=A0A2J7ZYR4_9CHLO|nr:hypothetical protein TSOC_008357 [Tetrabaena socialis]|eukprot:PNH05388.1 hypothetical protein TSOC_008357 [Tetrabaena socialis]